MAPRWAPDTLVVKVSRAVNLWQTQAPNQAASLPLSPLRSSYYRLHEHPTINYSFCCLNWKHISNSRSRGRKGWLCRASHARQKLGLHTSTLCLNTSASRWSAGLSQHMSRIRSTLDTVSKAVSGTHTELKSKIARLKPNVSQASKEGQVKDSEAALKTEKGNFSPVPAPSHVDSLTSAATINSTKTSLKVEEASNKTSAPSHNNVQSTTTATTPSHNNVQSTTSTTTPSNNSVQSTITTTTPSHNNVQSTTSTTIPSELDLKEKRLKPAVTMSESTISFKRQDKSKLSKDGRETKTTAISKATATPLLHPSTLSVSLDETYNYVAHHINNYFGSTTKAHENTMGSNANPSTSIQGQSSDITPVSKGIESTSMSAPSTQKKGLGHYLSYTAPTVQAFVGSYLSPLVPKFRTADPKLAVVEQRNVEDAPAKQTVVTVTKEPNAADEKAKMLLLQREKIIARLSVDNRTRALVQALHRASDVRIYINRVEDLSYHLLEFPETRGVAVKEKVIPCLLRMRQASDEGLRAAVREALSLVGYHDPVRGRGIRLLSIDGGGLRGLLALQTLHKLEILTGRPIYQLFDYICGVSTGAIVGFMLGLFQMPLSECDDLYRKLGSDVFKQNVIVGTVKMGWNHAFYDSETWEKILKEKMGSDLLVETSRNPKCPKVAAVSTIVNQGTPLKAYVFRNYNLLPGVRSHYRGGCQHQLWQAVRASSAAPGYFQEFALGNDLHQDGGLLINNPTALAIHECKCLWPNTPLECVVSLGTGRFETSGKHSTTHTSLKTKLANIISSATDTEEVHTMLDALLPPDTYFRFNPHMSEEVTLDDSRQEKLNLLQAEALRYLERNEEKMKKAAAILTREKYSVQRLSDWARLRADMYDGLPSFSAKL